MTTGVPSLKPYAVSFGVPSLGGQCFFHGCLREGLSTGTMAGDSIGGTVGFVEGGILVPDYCFFNSRTMSKGGYLSPLESITNFWGMGWCIISWDLSGIWLFFDSGTMSKRRIPVAPWIDHLPLRDEVRSAWSMAAHNSRNTLGTVWCKNNTTADRYMDRRSGNRVAS